MSGKVLILAITLALADTLPAQSPVPVIVPAMTPASTAKAPAATTESDNGLSAALKLLQEMKAERKGSKRNVPHHTSDVFARSARLPDEDLSASEGIVPPDDLTLDEAVVAVRHSRT